MLVLNRVFANEWNIMERHKNIIGTVGKPFLMEKSA